MLDLVVMSLSISLLNIAIMVTMYTAFGIGANDETMAIAAGMGHKVIYIAILGGIMDFLGAIILGENVAKTIGKGIPAPGITITVEQVFILAVAIATWLTLASLGGWPVSTTHSAVGAVMGLLLVTHGINGINWEKIGTIMISWVISPVVGYFSTYILYKLFHRLTIAKIKGLKERVEYEHKFTIPLIIAAALTAFARGANDSSNACGILYAVGGFDPLFVRALAGGFMAIGLLVIGRKVISNVGTKVVELTPSSAFIAQINAAVIELLFAYLGIPLSGTHMTVAALIGAGVAVKSKPNLKSVRNIVFAWVVTFPAGAGFAAGMYLVASWLGFV